MARDYQPLTSVKKSPPPCPRCANRGLIAIRYRDHSPWDIALCPCRIGQLYRTVGERLIRVRHPWITAEHQVGHLEDFDEVKPMPGEVFKG